MNSKELQERLQSIENKIDKIQNIEERLEKCFQNVEKFRDKMIQKGYSYAMLEEFNHAIQPITQHYNEIRNARKKLEILKEEQRRLAKEEEEINAKRRAVIVGKLNEFPYNHKCRNFSFVDGQAMCEVKMDLTYCNRNCPYATGEVCSYKVDARGNTVVKKK